MILKKQQKVSDHTHTPLEISDGKTAFWNPSSSSKSKLSACGTLAAESVRPDHECMPADCLPDGSQQKRNTSGTTHLFVVCVCVCVRGGGCVCAFRIALLNGIVELHHKSAPHQGDKMKRAHHHKTSVTVPSATNT